LEGSAFVAGARIFGQQSIRSAAVTAAESAIDRALADRPIPVFAKPIDAIIPPAEELNSLRFELASFALKLDDFEARLEIRRGQTQKVATAPHLAEGAEAVADVSQAKPDRPRR
jgi:hypothetical protein